MYNTGMWKIWMVMVRKKTTYHSFKSLETTTTTVEVSKRYVLVLHGSLVSQPNHFKVKVFTTTFFLTSIWMM